MMGNTPEYRLMNQAYSYKKIRITQCDPATGYIEGRDSANQQIQVTFAFFQSPYIQVPKIGEHWLVTRLDNNWVIHSRFEEPEETLPVGGLVGGDVRINAPNRLFLNPEQELICDFNKAKNSFAELGTATFPGSALYGSATLDQVNMGTANITEKVITPIKTYLPSRNVADGQEERILISQDDIVWTFRYREDSTSPFKWDFVGGPEYMDFIPTGATASLLGAWYYTKSPDRPALTIPYTGEYIISGGAEGSASVNDTAFSLGLSINESVPTATISAFMPKKEHLTTVATSYKLTTNIISLNKGDVLREGFRLDAQGPVTVLYRWMKIIPIRVQADPNDDPEPITILPYEGSS